MIDRIPKWGIEDLSGVNPVLKKRLKKGFDNSLYGMLLSSQLHGKQGDKMLVKKINLKDPYPIHWKTSAEKYEYMARLTFMKGCTIADQERKFWFPRGWEAKLEEMRKQHRSAGIPDARFYHAQHKKELGL